MLDSLVNLLDNLGLLYGIAVLLAIVGAVVVGTVELVQHFVWLRRERRMLRESATERFEDGLSPW